MNKTTTDLVAMFKVKAYPTNVIFGKDGRVVYKKEGLDLEGMAKALASAGYRP
jgi:thioredoxin-related protein